MGLRGDPMNKLSEVVVDDVAQYITEDPRFVVLILEIIPEAIESNLGKIDVKVVTNLSKIISNKLRCSSNYSEVFYPRCPIPSIK